jgi:hypothetical protein
MKLMELYKKKIMGAIKGLDRIRFRGTIRWLANDAGIKVYLRHSHVLLKDFARWANDITLRVRKSCERRAVELGIEMRYLRSGAINKEKLAREIAELNGITEGSICMFSVVEPCVAPAVKGDRATKKLTLQMRPRKCVWIYHYFNDPEFGFGHVRLQTWLPLNVFICLNGRHWLERALRKNEIGYVKDGNCFPWIEDIRTAQELMDKQLESKWPVMLNRMALETCPELSNVIMPYHPEYYWSADETEWATDIMFSSIGSVDKLYPYLLHHAMRVSASPSVMKYLGKRDIHCSGLGKGRVPKEIISDYRQRYEGVRVKHWINHNSVKMYNKVGSILRFETTINNTREFKVFRHPDDDKSRPASWQKMRKGVSDLHRRCEVSDKCNERYADALASAQVEEKLKEVVSPACNRIKKNGKTYRGLNPWQEEDYKLLTFLAKGENAISGFRNKNLRKWIYPESEIATKQEQKKCSGRTTRRIKLLRAHGLIKKVAKENRYMLTAKGQKFACALMAASVVDIKGLTKIAA